MPIGWYRFGIKIREEYINNKIEMSNWHIGYHGTSKNVVKSIIEHRRIMFPGDTLNDGTKLEIKNGQCHTEGFEGPVIYVTPSINYAKLYAPCSDINGRNVSDNFAYALYYIEEDGFEYTAEDIALAKQVCIPMVENYLMEQ